MRYVLWILMAAACGFSAMARDDYFPLAVGDEWTMTVRIAYRDGHAEDGVYRRKIDAAVEKDGKSYVHSRTSFEGMPYKGEPSKLMRKDEKAVYSIDERGAGAIEQVEAVLPLKPGAKWERIVRGSTMTDTVIGIETVTISGKVYKSCYHIRSTWSDGTFTKDSWQAPNVGTVKKQVAYADGLTFYYMIKEFKTGK